MVNLEEEKYKGLTEREACLKRPQRFIGSITKEEKDINCLVLGEKMTIEKRKLEISAGFERVFLEILTNAADNVERSRRMGIDPGKIAVKIKKNKISIYNEGVGIPTGMNKAFGIPTPQKIFSEFSCGSNFDDDEENTGCGTFGIGASATNVFSKKFVVEIGDEERKIKYKQIFRDNLTKIGKPKEKEYGGTSYVKITYILDFEKIGYTKDYEYEKDIIEYYQYLCLNIISFSCDIPLELNGYKIKFKSLDDYAKIMREKEKYIVYEDDNAKLVMVDKGSNCMTLVNNIPVEGGTHLDKILDSIKKILNKNEKIKGLNINNKDILNNIILCYSLKLKHVEYDSASKNKLKTPRGKIPSIKATIFSDMTKWKMIKKIIEQKKNASGFHAKNSGKNNEYASVKKLADAELAGKKTRKEETYLLLAEGDSAQSSAVKGLGDLRRTHGVLALKGKPINTTKHDIAKIEKNSEFISIVTSMGFKLGSKQVDYTKEEANKTLRYDNIILFGDPDVDGEHIKAILINMIYNIWPSFIKAGKLKHMIVPIKIATKGRKCLRFYTEEEFEKWEDRQGWNIKYIKGLGTIEDQDIIYEFSNPRIINLELDEDAPMWLDKAFNEKKADERKKWIHEYVDGKRYNYPEGTISNFMTTKYILYAMDDWKRSLPRIDGLKTSQRKILFVSRKTSSKKQIKVAQLAGDVAKSTQYHHGESSLCSAIINMANKHVNSNNIPLLHGKGQFGTRTGKDAAAPRYIYAQLDPLTKYIFRKEDDILLDYLQEDGQQIEPDVFYPIISTLHVNGSRGIGTGYSIDLGCYHPLDIIKHHKLWIESKRYLTSFDPNSVFDFSSYNFGPWYRGFRGDIRYVKRGKSNCWISRGDFEINKNVVVTELPATVLISHYIEQLEKLKLSGAIKGFKNISKRSKHSKSDIDPTFIIKGITNPCHESLRLISVIPTTNIYVLTSKNTCQKFTVDSLLDYFCHCRYRKYQERKSKYIQILQSEIQYLTYKLNLISDISNGSFEIKNRSKESICSEMLARGYPLDLLDKISLMSLTSESTEKLRIEIQEMELSLADYRNLSCSDIWLSELNQLESKLLKINDFIR